MGADTSRSTNAAFQPRRFTSYERDANGSDEAMFRRYSRAQARFEQADPADSSYDLSDPQSFNRYPYTQNDPMNFIDPTGLTMRRQGDGEPDHTGGARAAPRTGSRKGLQYILSAITAW
ncbi:MAG: hypothetical protein M3416_01570 [Acidobacteriota bacterium]|nr:hypothetical protein [Acidobacteriota bacterium]